ncbi:MAG: YbhB/YbcL family Raf kinase inhibitor-like protein [Streptosporangiales bacterium]|nr:YbhB/YbcL family Raf kinase inhibitor-like protein [Streptosporangiales bacterium]
MNRTGLGRVARTTTVAAAGLLTIVPALAGCGVFSPGVDQETPVAMTVSSDAIVQNTLEARYTCKGGTQAANPPLSWAGAPAGTKSIAVVVDDSNAPITPYVYWVVFDINPNTSQIAEGQLPSGARVARNSAGTSRYDAPCPGSHSHQYRFTVYALNKVLNLPSGTSLQSAWSQIAAATIARGRSAPYALSTSP